MEKKRILKLGNPTDDTSFDKLNRCHSFDIVLIDAIERNKEIVTNDNFFLIDEIIILKIKIYEN